MITPYRGKVEVVTATDKMLVAVIEHFDCTVLNNAAMVPTAGYSVGTIQLIDKKTSLSTGVITWSVSNDPKCDVIVAHPTSTTQSAAGTKAGIALEHMYFGPQVTTIQGSAADETVVAEVWIVLKA